MSFLYLLEKIRVPWLDSVMLGFTALGGEIAFILIALVFLWCVDKYEGYFLLSIGFLGTSANQLLKVLFRVPRPWVLDPQFQAVEAAKPGAFGYSFPSGHTQNAVGIFGGLALWHKKAWAVWPALALCLVIPFSRMYLGVHTPLDVGVSFALALVLIFCVYPLIRRAEKKPAIFRWTLIGMMALAVAQTLFVTLFPFPADADAAELLSARETLFKMLGAVFGFYAAYEIDQRWLHYETAARWWVQILKVVLGLVLVLGVKVLSKALFALLPIGPMVGCLNYGLTVFFAAAVWPLTFKLFRKLER